MLERLALSIKAVAYGRKEELYVKRSYVAIIKINFKLFKNNNVKKNEIRDSL